MTPLSRGIAFAAVLGAVCVAKAFVRSVPAVDVPDEPFQIPLELSGWAGEDVPLNDGPTLEEIGVDWRLYRRYRRGNASADLLLEYNRPGSAREHTPDHCVRGRGWLWTSKADDRLEIPGRKEPFPITATIMESDGAKAGLVYWYQLGDRPFADHVRRKLSAIGRVLTLRPALPKAGVRIIASAPGATDLEVVAVAKEFAAIVAPYVNLNPDARPGFVSGK